MDDAEQGVRLSQPGGGLLQDAKQLVHQGEVSQPPGVVVQVAAVVVRSHKLVKVLKASQSILSGTSGTTCNFNVLGLAHLMQLGELQKVG